MFVALIGCSYLTFILSDRQDSTYSFPILPALLLTPSNVQRMSGLQKQAGVSKPAQNKLWGGRFTGRVHSAGTHWAHEVCKHYITCSAMPKTNQNKGRQRCTPITRVYVYRVLISSLRGWYNHLFTSHVVGIGLPPNRSMTAVLLQF